MERITWDNCVGPARYGHEFRYRLAAGFVSRGDWVLDAACGTGYGFEILYDSHGEEFFYLAVDQGYPDNQERNPSSATNLDFETGDLTTWRPRPIWDFDVFIGFETIEHLPDYSNYIDIAHRAEKWILLSTPVVPTRHMNPHHVHDFAPGDLQRLFENDEWEHYQTVQQPSELSEIVVLRRRT